MQEEVNLILKGINETTDRDISLIEDREKRLKSLLEEIEKRFKVYVREMEKFGGPVSPVSVKPADTYQELGKKRYLINKLESAKTDKLAEEPEPPAFPLRDFEIKPEGEKPPLTSAPQELPIGGQIRSLLRSGLSPQLVAMQLGLSISEVELAAALLQRRED